MVARWSRAALELVAELAQQGLAPVDVAVVLDPHGWSAIDDADDTATAVGDRDQHVDRR